MAKESKSTSLMQWADYTEEDAQQDAEELKNAKNRDSVLLPQSKLKAGKNRFRILPALERKDPPKWKFGGAARVTYEHWIDVPGLGQVRFTCPLYEEKKKCRGCEAARRLAASSKKSDQERAKSIEAKRAVLVNAIDRDNEERGPIVFKMGPQIEKQLVEMRADEDLGGNFIDPVKGFDVLVLKSGTGFETKYEVRPADKGRSSPLSDDAKQANEWMHAQHDLESFVKVYSDEDIERLLNGEKPEAWGGKNKDKGSGRSISDEVDDIDNEDD